jgi:hypothetical protein
MRTKREVNASIVSTDWAARTFDAVTLIVPAVLAWIAFSQSAQAHALDVLLGQGACGNPARGEGTPLLLGHCLECWSSGTISGAVALLALMSVRSALEPRGGLRRIP